MSTILAITFCFLLGLSFSQSLPPSYDNVTLLQTNFMMAKQDILALLKGRTAWAPSMVRLAWHECGTYCSYCPAQGGPHANMRFPAVQSDPKNAGLEVPRNRLMPIYSKYNQTITLADFWQFAGVVVIELMAGPHIPFRPGRIDFDENQNTPPDRLVDATLGFPDKKVTANYLRDLFYRMGFNDQEIVALIGAHTIGECHAKFSGFFGPWTFTPTVFGNAFYVELVNWNWTVLKGTKQYESRRGPGLMMLHTDVSLMGIPEFEKWVRLYAADQNRWHQDFASAFQRLQELGVRTLLPPIKW